MKQFLVFLALLVIVVLMVIAFSAKGSFVMTGSVAQGTDTAGTILDSNSAAAQKARADDALQQAQQMQANAHAAAANETAQAQSAGSAISIAAQATAQALSVARAQIAMTSDAANFPSTQAAIFAQQTAQAIRVQATSDAHALLVAQLAAQQTAQANAVQGTADSRAALLVQQQAQTTATSQAMVAQQTGQALEAQTTAQAMRLEGITAIQDAGNSQRQNELMGWLVPVVVAIVIGVALFLGAKFTGGRIDAANARSRMKTQRLALPGPLYDAPTETVVFVDDPNTGYPTPQLIYTDDNGQSYGTGDPLTSQATVIDSQARPVNVIIPATGVIPAGQAETRDDAARHKLTMKLIRDAINHMGAQSNRIPPADQLGWLAGAWTNAVANLRPYGVEILPGTDGGTYLMGQYPTLQALYLAIGESKLSHFPPLVGSTGNG
jgi:hypothetical protein